MAAEMESDFFLKFFVSLTDRELDYYAHQATNRTKDTQTQK